MRELSRSSTLRSLTLEALAAWRALLGKLHELGEALAAAIEANDVVGAIATMMDMRRTRAALARVEAPAIVDGTAQEQAALREVSRSVQGAQVSEEMMRHWLARPLPPQAALLASSLGVAVLADSILPVVWDFEADLVILVGAELAPVAQVLLDLGQQRVVMMGASVAGAIEVAAVDEIPFAIRSLPVAPRQMVIHASEAGELVQQVKRVAEGAAADLKIHRNTMHAFSKTWLEQAIANIPAIARCSSVAVHDDTFAGLPMVIVAPGPSLAKNAHLLAALKGRAIITAFSHSLKPVLAAGVTPDLVVTVDPQDVRYHFGDLDVSGSTLVNGATVHASLYELPARRFLALSTNGNVDDWVFAGVGEEPIVPGGGSVATTAFSLALRWKCDPIIFVGLDLSFPEGKYYVATSTDGDARAEVDASGVMHVAGWSGSFRAMKAAGGPPASKERFVELPGWHGGTVPSSFMFSLFHRWFERALAQGVAATVYNCTEGGVRIEGMSHRPLAEIVPRLERTFDVEAMLAGATPAADRPARFAAYLRDLRQQMRRARKLATRVLGAVSQDGERLASLERQLTEALQPLGFVSLLALREVERAEEVANRAGSTQTFLAASADLMRTLIRIIDELAPLIDRAIDRIAD